MARLLLVVYELEYGLQTLGSKLDVVSWPLCTLTLWDLALWLWHCGCGSLWYCGCGTVALWWRSSDSRCGSSGLSCDYGTVAIAMLWPFGCDIVVVAR